MLNPPFERAVLRDHYCSSEAKTRYLWHPLDLMIQAGCLREAGWDVRGVDALALGLGAERARALVREWRPDVAVALVSERSWAEDRATIRMLRAEGVERIVGSGDFLRFGSGPIAQAEGLVDFCLTDFTTTHLPETLRAGEAAGGGIATLVDVRARRYHDLGQTPCDYPCPDHALFDPARYRMPYAGFTSFASVLTGYGCPFHCAYCHVGELGYRVRPVPLVVEDLRRARAAGLGQVYFRDATLNARRRHALEWLQAMDREGLAMPWAAFATARPMDDELASWMRRTGCQHLQIGIETLSEALRDGNDKPFDGDAHFEFVRVCHRNGIQVTAHLVFGLPGETGETLAATVDGLARAGFDYIAVNLAENRPGLPWRERGVELAIDPATGRESAGYRGPSVEALKSWRSRAYRRFYLRPGRVAREVWERLRTTDLADLGGLAREAARWVSA